jgi:hypothetical protein
VKKPKEPGFKLNPALEQILVIRGQAELQYASKLDQVKERHFSDSFTWG